MQPRIAAIALVAAALFICRPAFCQETPAAPVAAPAVPVTDEAKAKVISVATEAVKAAGMNIEDVNIVYDQGGQLWSERVGKAAAEGNEGILKHGNMENADIVYFDYKEPLKDVWVFLNKDTGEVMEVYQEE